MKMDQAFGKVQLQSGSDYLDHLSGISVGLTSNNDSYRDGRRVRDEIQLAEEVIHEMVPGLLTFTYFPCD